MRKGKFIKFNVFQRGIGIFLFICIDLIAICVSFLLAYYIKKTLGAHISFILPLRAGMESFSVFWWVPVVFILFIAHEGCYAKRRVFWYETKMLVKGVTLSLVAVLAIITLGKMTGGISRLLILLLWVNTLFIIPFFRLLSKGLLSKLGLLIENVLVVGTGEVGNEIVHLLNIQRFLGYNVKGFLTDNRGDIGKSIKIDGLSYPVLGEISQYRKAIRKTRASIVIIALPSLPYKKLLDLNNNLQHHVKSVLLIRDLKGIGMLNTELYQIFMHPLLVLDIKNNLQIPFNIFLKRLLDLSLALFLLPLVVVVTVIVGIITKIDSPGPLFYSQKRIGFKGKFFRMYKFRTMRPGAERKLKKVLESDPEKRKEWEKYGKLKDDPRITEIGKFLRRWSIDELPQVFNVLKGNLSFVGPRPVFKNDIKKYFKADRVYYFMVKPGITGLWQVTGRSQSDFSIRTSNDIWYALNWSLWIDIVILFKTANAVMKGGGAY